MDKIKAFIIHALGGYTKSEYLIHEAFSFDAGQQSVTESLMCEAERLYGKPADEWCKQMYDKIDKSLEQLTKKSGART